MNSNQKRQLLGPQEHSRGQKFNTKAMRGLQCGKPDFFYSLVVYTTNTVHVQSWKYFLHKIVLYIFRNVQQQKKSYGTCRKEECRFLKHHISGKRKKIMKRHFLSLLGVNRIKVPNLEIKVSKVQVLKKKAVIAYRNPNKKVAYFDGKQQQ